MIHTPHMYRFGEEELPGVDIFVCTADPMLEPPSIVMNTVLSAMSYNYPSKKLSVYLSDDGGSELTFYALIRASIFSKRWIPFCKRFNIQTRSPEAYFSHHSSGDMHQSYGQQWSIMKVHSLLINNFISRTTHTHTLISHFLNCFISIKNIM